MFKSGKLSWWILPSQVCFLFRCVNDLKIALMFHGYLAPKKDPFYNSPSGRNYGTHTHGTRSSSDLAMSLQGHFLSTCWANFGVQQSCLNNFEQNKYAGFDWSCWCSWDFSSCHGLLYILILTCMSCICGQSQNRGLRPVFFGSCGIQYPEKAFYPGFVWRGCVLLTMATHY